MGNDGMQIINSCILSKNMTHTSVDWRNGGAGKINDASYIITVQTQAAIAALHSNFSYVSVTRVAYTLQLTRFPQNHTVQRLE